MASKIWLGLLLTIALSACNDNHTVQVSSNGGVAVGANYGAIVVQNGKVTAGPSVAWADGPEKTEIRDVTAFQALRIEVPVQAKFTVAADSSVAVKAPADILPLIRTEVKNGELLVSVSKSMGTAKPVELFLRGPSLRGVKLFAAASFEATGLKEERLDVQVQGASKLVLTGQAHLLNLIVAEASNVEATGLRATDLRAQVESAGQVKAYAVHSARVTASEAAQVTVAGNPERRWGTTASAGRVDFE